MSERIKETRQDCDYFNGCDRLDLANKSAEYLNNFYDGLLLERKANGGFSKDEIAYFSRSDIALIDKCRKLLAMNGRDSIIEYRKKSGTITQDQITKLMTIDSEDAFNYLKAMNGRDSEISRRKREGMITDEEILQLMKSDPEYSFKQLIAMNRRDSEILRRKTEGKITDDQESQLRKYNPEYAVNQLKAMNFIESELLAKLKTGEITQQQADELRKLNPEYAADQLVKMRLRSSIVTLYKKEFDGVLFDTMRIYLGKSGLGFSLEKELNVIDKNFKKSNSDYIVKDGDTLWDIVKNYYGLKDNKQIADKVNFIVAFNVYNGNKINLDLDSYPLGGDGIKGDKIQVGDKIFLPK